MFSQGPLAVGMPSDPNTDAALNLADSDVSELSLRFKAVADPTGMIAAFTLLQFNANVLASKYLEHGNEPVVGSEEDEGGGGNFDDEGII